MNELFEYDFTHDYIIELSEELYEHGYSCQNLVDWMYECDQFSRVVKTSMKIYFDKIKTEFRSEKLLILYLLDYLFMRPNKDIKSISTI